MDRQYTIKSNKIGIGRYVKMVMGLYIADWWWAYALPVVVLVSLGSVNANFYYVAVMVLFLIFSMAFAMVYIYYGLVPESRYSTRLKTMDVDENGVTLNYEADKAGDESEKAEEAGGSVAQADVIEWSRIKGIAARDECVLLMLADVKYAFVAIPNEAFEDETLEEVVLFIKGQLNRFGKSCNPR